MGTATELLEVLNDNNTNPNMVTKFLSKFCFDFLADNHIEYLSKRTNAKRLIKLIKSDDGDNSDADQNAVTPVTDENTKN